MLDVDVSHGRPGPASLTRAIRAGLVPRGSPLVRTPSGGCHLYFIGDSQRSAVLDRSGLDFRGAGGYVVAPPSMVDGRPYAVVRGGPLCGHVDFSAIRGLLEPAPERPPFVPRPGQSRTAHLAAYVAGLPVGKRNAHTFWALNRALEAGDYETAEAIVAAALSNGLDSRAVNATLRSALRTTARAARS